jgi:hypothetical protein
MEFLAGRVRNRSKANRHSRNIKKLLLARVVNQRCPSAYATFINIASPPFDMHLSNGTSLGDIRDVVGLSPGAMNNQIVKNFADLVSLILVDIRGLVN